MTENKRAAVIEEGKVAIITGAAMGIGRALALRLAQNGMSIVMADWEDKKLEDAVEAVRRISKRGPEQIIGEKIDVSDPEQILRLKQNALDAFGKVNLLVNNAVTRQGRGFDAELSEWHKAMDVNLWGPVYGVRAFLPIMLDNNEPAAIVNVASKQGITNPPGHPIYNMTKSALKTYTEALQHDLRKNPENDAGSRVTSHLLVPGWTTTGTAEHKPGAWLPDQVVDMLLEGIIKNQFYIVCPDDEVTSEMDKKRILWAAQDITENRPPLSRWHPHFSKMAKLYCG